jgi:methylmalonyl-CoA mutase N-terminal domain/subunit
MPELHRPDPAAERRQTERLAATRAARDDAAVDAALAELRRAAADEGENLMPHFIAAARARASEGEMIAALQRVFGTYSEHPQF